MSVIVAFFIVSISVIAILYKTYVGYGEYRWFTKLALILFLFLSAFGPLIGYKFRDYEWYGKVPYLNQIIYFLFGFLFFLFVLTMIRDILWMIIDFIRRAPVDNMKNPVLLQKLNIITLICCFLFCLYGVYEAEKDARFVTYEIISPKIKKETKLIMMTDLHIDKNTSLSYVKHLVDRVNAENPDVIVLVGDIADNLPAKLYGQIEVLKNLKAKDNVYFSLGNHEFYNDALGWGIALGRIGFQFLHNYGMNVGKTGIYIAGIPDINSAEYTKMKVNVGNALYLAKPEDYVIMLSHTPKIAEGITKDNVDLQLSGHTHGGQIYPFHYLAKQANDNHLAGFYDVDGVKLYVSRGTRYWGPPMRIFAPSEITIFNFKPEQSHQ